MKYIRLYVFKFVECSMVYSMQHGVEYAAHQQKTFVSERNGCFRLDALSQSRQRHPGGGLLCAKCQHHAWCCLSPSDRSFAPSSTDSARAFSDAPGITRSYGCAFRMLRDLTIRVAKFWRGWEYRAGLWETSREPPRETWGRIPNTVVRRVRYAHGMLSIIFVFVTVTRFATS